MLDASPLQRLPEKQVLAAGAAAITPEDAQALGAREADFVATLSAGQTLLLQKPIAGW